MSVLDLLFPQKCKICGKRTVDKCVCNSCNAQILSCIDVRKRLLFVDGRNIECIYLFDYDNQIVKRLLFALKRHGSKELFEYAASLYNKAVPEDFTGVCTNVPRRKTNVRAFGYDHVKMPIKLLCKQRNGIKYSGIIKRRGFSKDQKELHYADRIENAKGKYRIAKKDIPKDILLADDVITTGASSSQCVRVLMDGGCKNIKCIFLASA